MGILMAEKCQRNVVDQKRLRNENFHLLHEVLNLKSLMNFIITEAQLSENFDNWKTILNPFHRNKFYLSFQLCNSSISIIIYVVSRNSLKVISLQKVL